MKLQTFLNKFTGNYFLITVDGWCWEMPFSDYEFQKTRDYWKNYKNREIKSVAILTTNETPELYITLK